MDTISELAIGPSFDKDKAHSCTQTSVFDRMDKINLIERTPKAAYNIIAVHTPAVQDLIQKAQKGMSTPEWTADDEVHLQNMSPELRRSMRCAQGSVGNISDSGRNTPFDDKQYAWGGTHG